MKSRRSASSRLTCLFAATVVLAAHGAFAARFSAFSPAPIGLVLVARPTVYWPVFLGPDAVIKTVTLTVNGIAQPFTYDPVKQLCTATFDKPLAAGDYVGRIDITFEDGTSYEKIWQFSISPDAVPALPPPDGAQTAATNAVNGVRRQCGLLDVVLSPSLCSAAMAHSRYMNLNGAYSHLEQVGLSGFTGVSPEDRVEAWGYPLGDFEDISSESKAMDKMVQGLMNAPYHREAFLQPGVPDFGYGAAEGKSTLEFGITSVEGVSIYPSDGQVDVPVSWKDDEYPDPLRIHPGAAKVVGYPITLFYYGPSGSAATLTSAALTASDGTDVPVYVNRDANDPELRAGVIVIPQAPLSPGTIYTVKVQATTLTGLDISRTWSFTTLPYILPVTADPSNPVATSTR